MKSENGGKKMDMNERKQQFIRWLLDNYKHSNPSVNYLLQFLSTHTEYLPKIRFSEAVKYAPRGIYISYQNNSPEPFIYYKDHFSYSLSDQAFHDLRLNNQFNKQDFYIEFNIPDLYKELYRFDVFEDNPYIPEDDKDLQKFERVLYELSFEAKVMNLKVELDKALEEHNFEEADFILKQIEILKGE